MDRTQDGNAAAHVLCLRVLEGDEVRDLGAAAFKMATYRVAVGAKTAGIGC